MMRLLFQVAIYMWEVNDFLTNAFLGSIEPGSSGLSFVHRKSIYYLFAAYVK